MYFNPLGDIMRNPTETKQKLMDTATQLIWQSNYSSVGVAEICKQAGLTKGSFYHHFETKADLFYEASKHYWEELKLDLDKIFSPSYSPLEQLENMIEFIITEQQTENLDDDNPVSACPFFTAGSQAGVEEEKVRQAAIEMSDKAGLYHVALVRGLMAEGVLNSDPDPVQLGRLMHNYVMGLLLYGRVYKSLEVIKTDLREGIYRLLDMKNEFRRHPGPEEQIDENLPAVAASNT